MLTGAGVQLWTCALGPSHLPCAQVEAALGDGDGQARTKHGALAVG